MSRTDVGRLFYVSPNGMVLAVDCAHTSVSRAPPSMISTTNFDSLDVEVGFGIGRPPELTATLVGEHKCLESGGMSGLLQLVMEQCVKDAAQLALSGFSTSGNRRMEERIASLQSSLEKAEGKITQLSNKQKRTARRLSPLFEAGSQRLNDIVTITVRGGGK